jgi:hypothetical protein
MSSYVRHGRDFRLPTVARSVRERNVRTEPWMTMTVTEGDRDSHLVVLLEGPAEVVALAAVPVRRHHAAFPRKRAVAPRRALILTVLMAA